jgi:catechol 2,3-dioxygenase
VVTERVSTSIHPDTSLGTVDLTVSDLARSQKFYGDILGLVVRRRDGTTAELGTGAASLLRLWERPGARPKPPHATGLYHFAVLLPARADLARALRRLSETRYEIDGASDHLVSEAIYLADPDENGIEIYADRPRSAWRFRNGQLQMATAPLDVDNLFAELHADPRPGAGLPDGARIGHVHLHVAHLQTAEAFYREVLGFDLMVRYGDSASFLSAGGYHHHIGLNTWAGVGAPPPPPDAAGLRYFTIRLPSRAELMRVLDRVRTASLPAEETPDGYFIRDTSQNGMMLAGDR